MRILNKILNAPLGALTLILALFFLINVTFFLPIAWQNIISIYISMTAFAYAIPDTRAEFFKYTIRQKIIPYMLWFIGSWIIGTSLRYIFFNDIGTLNPVIIIIQANVIAFAEESLFRGGINKWFQSKWIGSTIFAGFHLVVSNGDVFQMMAMFILGMVWSYIAEKIGLIESTASHGGWNSATYGL